VSITIDLAPELEAELMRKAESEGRSAEAVAHMLLAEVLEWEIREREEAAAGIRRGLEAGAAGRVKPLSQVIREARERHGFDASWPGDLEP
jgi:predicted transcriptional regulator